jgi:hypothetical protein
MMEVSNMGLLKFIEQENVLLTELLNIEEIYFTNDSICNKFYILRRTSNSLDCCFTRVKNPIIFV